MAERRALILLRSSREATPALSDESLAMACSAGDPGALAGLFDRYQALVTRYLSRLVRSQVDVEDLLQTTFLQVAQGGSRYQGRSSVRTWLLGIATNVARHHFRSHARRTRLLAAAARDGEVASRSAQPESLSEARQLLERARAALANLSAERRFAFVLCEIEGLSAREAALVLGTSEQAVWRRVSDARRSLCAVIDAEER